MNKTNLSPINDLSAMVFDELFSRFQSLDTECLLIYLFDKVEESAWIVKFGEITTVLTGNQWPRKYSKNLEKQRE